MTMQRTSKVAIVVFLAIPGSFLAGILALWFAHQPPDGGHNLLTASESDMRVERFEVQDHSGSPVWVIAALPGQSVSAIHYGVVPQGFRQLVPASGGRPRPLVPNERLTTVTLSQDWHFVHHGVALGPDRFLGGSYTNGPRSDRPRTRPRV